MLNTKDAGGFLAPLAPHVRMLQAVTIPGEENPHPAAEIVAAARAVGIAALQAETIDAAVRDIIGRVGPGRGLVCGSPHLARGGLAGNQPPEEGGPCNNR